MTATASGCWFAYCRQSGGRHPSPQSPLPTLSRNPAASPYGDGGGGFGQVNRGRGHALGNRDRTAARRRPCTRCAIRIISAGSAPMAKLAARAGFVSLQFRQRHRRAAAGRAIRGERRQVRHQSDLHRNPRHRQHRAAHPRTRHQPDRARQGRCGTQCRKTVVRRGADGRGRPANHRPRRDVPPARAAGAIPVRRAQGLGPCPDLRNSRRCGRRRGREPHR